MAVFRRIMLSAAPLLCVAALTACSFGPGPNDIVYPTDIPRSDTSTAPRPTVSAEPVHPDVTAFCSDLAAPILQFQLSIDEVIDSGAPASSIVEYANAVRSVLERYAQSPAREVSSWIVAGTAYVDRIEAAAMSPDPPDQLLPAVGEADQAIRDLILVCAGQPGWE